MATIESKPITDPIREAVGKLETAGWGIFFVWVGIAILLDVGWEVGIVGVGAIAIGTQAARKYFGLPVERFGLVLGMVCILWGTWSLLNLQFGEAMNGNIIPILSIVLGVALFASAMLRASVRQ